MTQGASVQGWVAVLEEIKPVTEEDDKDEYVSDKTTKFLEARVQGGSHDVPAKLALT